MSSFTFDMELHDPRETLPHKRQNTSFVVENTPHANRDTGSPLLDSSCLAELQSLIQGFPVQKSPKMTAFGVSPPVRSGRNGGAENPLTFDPTWQTLAPTCVRRNLHAIRKNERRFQQKHAPFGVRDVPAPIDWIPHSATRRETCREGIDATAKPNPFTCEVRYYD